MGVSFGQGMEGLRAEAAGYAMMDLQRFRALGPLEDLGYAGRAGQAPAERTGGEALLSPMEMAIAEDGTGTEMRLGASGQGLTPRSSAAFRARRI